MNHGFGVSRWIWDRSCLVFRPTADFVTNRLRVDRSVGQSDYNNDGPESDTYCGDPGTVPTISDACIGQ